MISKKVLSNVIYLSVGVVIGFCMAMLFAVILYSLDPDTLADGDRTFGDVKVWVEKIPDDPRIDHDAANMIYVARAGQAFLAIEMDSARKINRFSILDENQHITFTLAASKMTSRWERGLYGGNSKIGEPVGEGYVDIDFNGQFDAKHVYNDIGEKLSGHIYIHGNWLRAVGDLSNVIAGQTKYTFDPNSGCWHEK